jgi:hypothetical protein
MHKLILLLAAIKFAFICEQEPSVLNCFIGLLAIIAGSATWLFILAKLGNHEK